MSEIAVDDVICAIKELAHRPREPLALETLNIE
jgi:hypothetical protein